MSLLTLSGALPAVFRPADSPVCCLIQPVGSFADAEALLPQIDAGAVPFAYAAFEVPDWNAALTPWPAPSPFGGEPFGGQAAETLRFLRDELLPQLPKGVPLVLGGYSLAGLFALWAAAEVSCFAGAAAASPSVWYPGWQDYARSHPVQVGKLFLSLGVKESAGRNPALRTAADGIRLQYQLAVQLIGEENCSLVWNPGGHFTDPEGRTAKAFSWVLEAFK